MKYLFLSRASVLPAPENLASLAKDAIASLLSLKDAGYKLVVCGTATELLSSFLKSQGITFDDVIGDVGPGELSRKYLSGGELDFERSAAIDCPAAEDLGLTRVTLENGWKSLATQLVSRPRTGMTTRKTKETAISAEVSLDGGASAEVNTGIGFFDHMLEQIAKHGGFTLKMRTVGDLKVDDHHTVEDTAIVLGQAMRKALGDKLGIHRYGFVLPMDEAEVKVSVDLSGRPYLVFDGTFPRDTVGGLATEMVPHFFRSFAEALGATLHIGVTGTNTHHMVESTFKGVGRALRMAIAATGTSELPSTKGML